MRKPLALLAASLYLACCQTDTVGIDDVDIIAEPVIALPIGEINLTLDHLLVPDDSLIFDDNTNYKVVVSQDSVFSIEVADLISIPAQTPISSTISMGVVSIDNVASNTDLTLGQIASDIGQPIINASHGINAVFPPISDSNIGTYGGGALGTFTSVSFSDGNMILDLTNDWPVNVSLGIDLVNAVSGSTVVSFNFTNVSGNGGIQSDTASLIGKSLPNIIGFKLNSISSLGSGANMVPIDTTKTLKLDLSTFDLEVYTGLTSLTTQTISSGTQYVAIGSSANEKLQEIFLTSGKFEFEFNSSLANDIEFGISFPGSNRFGLEIDTTIYINSNQVTNGSINFNNTLLDLTLDTIQNYSQLPVAITATIIGSGNQVTVDSSDALNMTFEMTNLDFGYIKGFFGTQNIMIDNGAVPLAIDFLENFDGSITFVEPSISMDITNSIGLPIQLGLDFDSYLNGTASSLNGPDFVLPYPTTIGDTETGTLTYDNTNSQISDVFTLPKDSIVYGGAVVVNHDTTTFGTNNFVTSTGAISGDLLMELPFTIQATGLAFGDTLAQDLDLAGAVGDGLTVDAIKLFLSNTTTLPLNATVALKFYDENWNEVHLETVDLLVSGVPNSNGIVTSPSTSDITIDLSGMDLENVLNAKAVIAEATMDTYNTGADPVKLRTDASIIIGLGVQLEVSLTL